MTRLRRHLRLPLLLAAGLLLGAGLASADEYLVYIGGGLEPIDGGWTEQHGQVIFTQLGGKLVSAPYDYVDLPASTFITWQLNGRRRVPPRPALETLPEAEEEAPPCTEARLARLIGGETLEVQVGDAREIVHVACLDVPETEHKFAELGWFGRTALSAVESEIRPGAKLCLTEQTPARRDGQGHRLVYVTLGDGRDFATAVIAGGFGMLRPAGCRNGDHYRAAEDYAIGEQRGLWGRQAARPALAAATNNSAKSAGMPAVPPRSTGGG